MKKTSKAITGVSTSSIVGLKAILAQEKSSLHSAPLASRIQQKTMESNKGMPEVRIDADGIDMTDPLPCTRCETLTFNISSIFLIL